MTSKQRERKVNALARLVTQLEKGSKPEKVDGRTLLNKNVSLSDGDKTRIKKEIDILSKKVS